MAEAVALVAVTVIIILFIMIVHHIPIFREGNCDQSGHDHENHKPGLILLEFRHVWSLSGGLHEQLGSGHDIRAQSLSSLGIRTYIGHGLGGPLSEESNAGAGPRCGCASGPSFPTSVYLRTTHLKSPKCPCPRSGVCLSSPDGDCRSEACWACFYLFLPA